eukprot:9466750-Pyramimonas_sp.AAC.1
MSCAASSSCLLRFWSAASELNTWHFLSCTWIMGISGNILAESCSNSCSGTAFSIRDSFVMAACVALLRCVSAFTN